MPLDDFIIWDYAALCDELGIMDNQIHRVDGLPIPLGHFRRARSCRLFAGEPGYGHCASKNLTYYGFQSVVIVSSAGVITGFTVMAANHLGLNLQTPLRHNMVDDRPTSQVRELMRDRRLVETVIDQLTNSENSGARCVAPDHQNEQENSQSCHGRVRELRDRTATTSDDRFD